MKAHFQKLYGEISLTAMDYIIEEQCLPVATPGSNEHALLRQIYETNDLDERHLICARYLGYDEHAQQLEAWIDAKKLRKARRP
jgi:hypothetical protein